MTCIIVVVESMPLLNNPEDRIQTTTSVVADALAYAKKAEEMREAAIAELLAQRERIDADLKTLRYIPPGMPRSGNGAMPHGGEVFEPIMPPRETGGKRFKDMALAEIGKVILAEHGGNAVHGKEIERIARAGGFKGADNFQNYMPVAFKRAGGFENIGGNRWRLNADIQPKR